MIKIELHFNFIQSLVNKQIKSCYQLKVLLRYHRVDHITNIG